MHRPFIIAVTGGIGSGKSAVTDRFSAHAVPVFDADVIARQLVEPGELALAEIVAVFGSEVLDSNGRLDRAALRAVVFNDSAAREQLNAILHPRVRTRLRTLAHRPGPHYVLLAIPLLAESAHPYDWLDRILVVDVPRELQIQRAMGRDRMDRPNAERLLAAQTNRAIRLALADDVICNDGPIELLTGIVQRLHGHYLELARMRERV